MIIKYAVIKSCSTFIIYAIIKDYTVLIMCAIIKSYRACLLSMRYLKDDNANIYTDSIKMCGLLDQ